VLPALRIFLASPGDVADERVLALKVLERLPYDPLLRDKVAIQIVAWDKPGAGTPMLATMTPQEAITKGLPKPSACDIVVAVFWSRMGTPLPEDWVKPAALRYRLGTGFASLDARFLSGTEWEYFDAVQAAEATGRPKVLVYRRTAPQSLDQEDAEFDEKRKQWKLVKAFFDAFRNPDGSLRRGYNAYATPSDFEQALEHDLRALIKALLSEPAASDQATTSTSPTPIEPPLWPGSPFPGLRPLTTEDWPIFFGRGRETDALIRKLADRSHRFTAIMGASGSGKSSLVWAGLIPRLLGITTARSEDQPRIGAIAGSQDWVCTRFTPGELGDNPFLALATSLKPTLDRHGKAPRAVAAELQNKSDALDRWVTRVLKGRPDWAELVLFIDQFEELFTLVRSKEMQRAFIELLVRAARTERLRIVITLRADFYHRCLEWEALSVLLRTGSFPLAAPGVGALHEMITRPAERAGLTFDAGLPARILNETGTEPGALALMAFALHELYEARRDGCLTEASYDAFGGVQGAIGKRVDDVFEALPGEVQAKLSEVFRELLEVDERGTATRRRAPLGDVTRSKPAQTLVHTLTEARLLVTDQSEGHAPRVEVAHEALFRSWPRLAAWIQATADDHRLRRQITQLAEYWDTHERQDTHRWSDDRLLEVVDLCQHLGLRPKDFSELERDFLGPLDRTQMQAQLDEPTTSHEQRAIIGVRLSILGDPRPGVGLRVDGLPEIAWCAVPAGEVTLEDGAGTFAVEPFYIAQYPLTYVQYRAFLEARDGFHDSAWWQGLPFVQPEQPGKQFNRRDNHPAENIAWDEAIAFCRWLSARLGYDISLPTEWQWQQAATGGDADRAYPWGPTWDGRYANTVESDLSRSTAVGVYPAGVSPVGALDMAGNVWEWCLNEYEDPRRTDLASDAERVVRGGSWVVLQDLARVAYRNHNHPNNRNHNIGVRLACLAHTFTPLQRRGPVEVFSTGPLRAHPPWSARVLLPEMAADYGLRPEAKG
jgi:hypothetical protein